MRIGLGSFRRVGALVAALSVVLSTTLLLPAAPAAAHGQLAVSAPLADTMVDRPLEHVALYFTEQPHAQAHFTLRAPGGARVDGAWAHGEPKRLDKPVQEYYLVDGRLEPTFYHTGYPALLTVAHWPVTGRYTATWLSVASDGDEVKGSLSFDYRGPTGGPPAGWTAPTNEAAPALLALLEQGHRSRPGVPGSAAPAGTAPPASAPAAAPAQEEGGGIGAWVVPGIVVAVVVVIVWLAARRRGSTTGPQSRPVARRPSTPGRAGPTRPSKRRPRR
ncbi:copper resistance protein CopC [Micromonospora sp. NPDC000207]|uniref:copper resistance protein CopC n=1 Tax=Micromonospora sp. NPDC000207 TaxID=3154246 RepID=UPI003319C2BB